MRIPCRVWIGIAGLTFASCLSASAQTDTNEGTDESELSNRVRQLEEQQEQSFEREISAIRKEISRLEQAAAKRKAARGEASPNRAKSVAVSDNRWRFKYHEGRWWFWLPEEHWVYWSSNRWVHFQEPAASAVTPTVHVDKFQAGAARSSDASQSDQADQDADSPKSKAASGVRASRPPGDVKRRSSPKPDEIRRAQKGVGATQAR